jgi:hypothetical protein
VAEHIAIRRPEFVAGTSERPEVRVFTQTHAARHPVPWGRIGIGDAVYMKWTAGPVVARATVSGFRQIADTDAKALRAATFGSDLHDLDPYWSNLPPRFDAVCIYLEGENWLDEPVPVQGRSYGESWVVFPDAVARERWLETPPAGVDQPSRGRRTRTLSASLRFAVFRRDNYSCRYCGRRAPFVVLHIDHVEAWSRGGANRIENLVTACQECNLGKGAGAA